MTGFNAWDIAFAVVLLFSANLGRRRGAVIDTVATLVFIAAVIGGLLFASDVGSLILRATDGDQNPWVMPLGFVVVFSAVVIVGALIRRFIDDAVSESSLRPADRMIGLLLGLVRGALIVLVFIACMMRWYPDSPGLEGSFSYQLLNPFHADMNVFIDWLVG